MFEIKLLKIKDITLILEVNFDYEWFSSNFIKNFYLGILTFVKLKWKFRKINKFNIHIFQFIAE